MVSLIDLTSNNDILPEINYNISLLSLDTNETYLLNSLS